MLYIFGRISLVELILVPINMVLFIKKILCPYHDKYKKQWVKKSLVRLSFYLMKVCGQLKYPL